MCPRISGLAVVLLLTVAPACGGDAADATSPAGASSSGGGGAGGGVPDACAPSYDGDTIHLAASAAIAPAHETTMCLRWTTPERLDITGFVGTLGPAGHHALLLSQSTPSADDGLAPCSEAELMDVENHGEFQMLAGVSYESSGEDFEFPSSPVQVGLSVPAGSQLVFDAHFLNAGSAEESACATLDLRRGAPVVARLGFRTILPASEYSLAVPAHGSLDVDYSVPTGEKARIAAASSHMHEGGTHFRLSIAETDQTLFETSDWADPLPAIYDTKKIVVEDGQTYRLQCSFANTRDTAQRFPSQMCVGGLYVLSCALPGAC